MERIFTQSAPRPAGHYSQAIVHDNLVYVSGQLPIDPITGEKRLGSIEEQTEQVLKNVAMVNFLANIVRHGLLFPRKSYTMALV